MSGKRVKRIKSKKKSKIKVERVKGGTLIKFPGGGAIGIIGG